MRDFFGENPSHYFYEFLLPNNQKDQINSQINKVTETAKIKFPELFQNKILKTPISEFDLNENPQIFPLEIPTYADLCCPPPPLEMIKELLPNQMSDNKVWSQKQPDVPPPDIEYLYLFRNQEPVANFLIGNPSVPKYNSNSNVNILMSNQLNRTRDFFLQLIEKINERNRILLINFEGSENQNMSMQSSLNTAKGSENQTTIMRSPFNTAEEQEIQINDKSQIYNNEFSYSFYKTAQKYISYKI